MSKRSTQHATFVIEREYPFPPARVFAAWADLKTKARWFAGPEGKWAEQHRGMDFRLLSGEQAVGDYQFARKAIHHIRKKVVAAGGKIHVEEQAVPGMGTFSLFTDPEGRMMGLWKSVVK